MFSHWYFIVPLRDTRLTILTSKELRYKLLTFTIFIIQSQVGAIPVFSRLCKSVFINSLGINQNSCCYLKERLHSVSQLEVFAHSFILAEENSKGKKGKWEPVVLDDFSFFAGEMDGFVSLEVMEDYDLEELTGIGAGGPARKKKIKEWSLQKVNCLKYSKTYRTVKFRR